MTFAEATPQDLQRTSRQIEQLARSRYWDDVRDTVNALYRRVFGTTGPPPRNGG